MSGIIIRRASPDRRHTRRRCCRRNRDKYNQDAASSNHAAVEGRQVSNRPPLYLLAFICWKVLDTGGAPGLVACGAITRVHPTWLSRFCPRVPASGTRVDGWTSSIVPPRGSRGHGSGQQLVTGLTTEKERNTVVKRLLLGSAIMDRQKSSCCGRSKSVTFNSMRLWVHRRSGYLKSVAVAPG